MRIFLGFAVPDGIRDDVRSLQDHLRGQGIRGKWTRPENLHLTVLFLGEQEGAELTPLSEALQAGAADTRPFVLDSVSLGTFGRPPRVLHLGWHGGGVPEYGAFAQLVRECAESGGIPVSESMPKRGPRPHLTMARFRGAREARALKSLGRREADLWEWEATRLRRPLRNERLPCEELLLFRSILHPTGPEYRILEQFPLGRAAAGREATAGCVTLS